MTMQLGDFLALMTGTGDTLLPADPVAARDGAEFDGVIGVLMAAPAESPPDLALLQRAVGNELPFDGRMLPSPVAAARLPAPEGPVTLPAASTPPAETSQMSSGQPTAATHASAIPPAASIVKAGHPETKVPQAANDVPVARLESGYLLPAVQKLEPATHDAEPARANNLPTHHSLNASARPSAPAILPAVLSNPALTSGRPPNASLAEPVTVELKQAVDAVQRTKGFTPTDPAARRVHLPAAQLDDVSTRPLSAQAEGSVTRSVPATVPVPVPNPVHDMKSVNHELPSLPDIVQSVRSELVKPVKPGPQPMPQPMPHIDTQRPEASLQTAILDAATTKITADLPPERIISVQHIAETPGMSTLTQFSSAKATSAPNMPAFNVNTPVTDPDWGEAMGSRVAMLVGRNIGSAELRLNPADLGPVQVQLSVEEGAAKVLFSATHPVTREQLESALPRLREMLEQQGLTLTDASVSDHHGGDRETANDFEPDTAKEAASENSRQTESNTTAATAAKVTDAGRVDTYV